MENGYLNDAEIARNMGITRAGVGQTIRRSLRKIFFGYIYYGVADTAVESFNCILNDSGITCQEDIDDLFEKMPDDIKEMLKNEMSGKLRK